MRSVCDGTNDCQDASDEKPNICRDQPELRSQSFTSLMSFGFTFQRLSRAISSWKCCINLSDSKCKISILYLLSVFYQVNDWAPRLANGDNATHGRLEIKYKGVWGTICDDGFGPEEGSVACKMLGNIV